MSEENGIQGIVNGENQLEYFWSSAKIFSRFSPNYVNEQITHSLAAFVSNFSEKIDKMQKFLPRIRKTYYTKEIVS